MKKYMNELNYEEFEAVVKNSDELQKACIEYCEDNAYFWIEDYLSGIPKCIDYSISYYNDYMYIDRFNRDNWKAYIDIADWFNDLAYNYCIFVDDDKKAIDRLRRYAIALCDDDYGCINVKGKDYTFMSKKANEIVEELLSDILHHCQNDIEYWWNLDNCIEDVYERGDAFSNYYIDENGNLWEERFDRKVA